MKKYKRKRVIIITPRLNLSGGVASYWNSLLPIMRNDKNIDVDNFQVGGSGKNILSSIREQYKFRQKISSDFSIAFLNPSLGFSSFFRDGLFAKQLASINKPFLVFFHGWNYDFERKVSKKYQNFFLNSFGKAQKIIVLSRDFKNKIIEWGYRGEVVVETTNVDKTLIENFSFDKKQKNIQETQIIRILFLARMLRAKGVFETIESFERLEKKYNIELFIAGDGQDLEEVKKICKNNGKIQVLGRVEGQNKIDLFTKCHIYAFPTYYGEGLPTSILEAMAFGLPVITTNMGGLKEFFKDEKMGFFVKPEDSYQLSKKLNLLLEDRDRIARYSNFNYAYANRNLLSDIVANRIRDYIYA